MFVIGIAEMIFLIAIVLGTTFMFIVPLVQRRAMLNKPKRNLITGDDGEIVIIGEKARSKPFRKSGKGSFASDGLFLNTGVYRLQYKFPPTSPVALKLISIEDAEEVPILIKSGAGSHAFRIDKNGRYVVNLDPTNDSLNWEFEFHQL